MFNEIWLSNLPVNGLLPVTVKGSLHYLVLIVNIMGEVIYYSKLNATSNFEVDMQNFSDGIYLLNITDLDTHESQTSKVIKY